MQNSMDNHGKCCRHIHMPLLTDMYQITMTYAYWKNKAGERWGVFDMFFRKNPFGGEFTVFAGLEECIRFLDGFAYTADDINFFKSILPADVEPSFFDYLSSISAKQVRLYSVREGSIVFPKEPLMRIEGPLAICQLLETSLLTLVNFARFVFGLFLFSTWYTNFLFL